MPSKEPAPLFGIDEQAGPKVWEPAFDIPLPPIGLEAIGLDGIGLAASELFMSPEPLLSLAELSLLPQAPSPRVRTAAAAAMVPERRRVVINMSMPSGCVS